MPGEAIRTFENVGEAIREEETALGIEGMNQQFCAWTANFFNRRQPRILAGNTYLASEVQRAVNARAKNKSAQIKEKDVRKLEKIIGLYDEYIGDLGLTALSRTIIHLSEGGYSG